MGGAGLHDRETRRLAPISWSPRSRTSPICTQTALPPVHTGCPLSSSIRPATLSALTAFARSPWMSPTADAHIGVSTLGRCTAWRREAARSTAKSCSGAKRRMSAAAAAKAREVCAADQDCSGDRTSKVRQLQTGGCGWDMAVLKLYNGRYESIQSIRFKWA
jgi:hypothetical protein